MGNSIKHIFADTEIEIATKTAWMPLTEIHVVATMRPRRPLSRLWRKTATDTADMVLEVDFPEDEAEGVVGITEARRSSGSVSAMYSYKGNPWDPRDLRWWEFWRRQKVFIRYSIQVDYLGNSYAFYCLGSWPWRSRLANSILQRFGRRSRTLQPRPFRRGYQGHIRCR